MDERRLAGLVDCLADAVERPRSDRGASVAVGEGGWKGDTDGLGVAWDLRLLAGTVGQ